MPSKKSHLAGQVEYHDRTAVKGWAIDLASPERPVSVQVVAAGRIISELAASAFRWDLMQKFEGSGNHGFVYRLPQEILANGPLRINVRFSESHHSLEGGVFETSSVAEQLHTPVETSDLTGCRVLVLAPHPDDESLTCGGSLVRHTRSGDPVKVVFLTDGSKGNFTQEYSDRGYVELRRQEATEACRILGIHDLDFWDQPDRALAVEPETISALCSLLNDYEPGLVYAPSPQEFHPDHRAAAQLLWRAIERSGIETRVAFYESNRPIHVSHLVDIGEVVQTKTRACDAYASQLRHHPYTELATALSRYRSLTLPLSVKHAEGFFVLSSSEMRGRPVDWFTVRQHLPMAPSEESTRPLVSVIVRTRDRPVLLREALSSILTQTYSNLEVVVVDDGGSAGSHGKVQAVVKEFERFFPVRLIPVGEPGGRAAAATLGARQARGKYLNFLDDDDLLYSDHLSKLVGFLESTGERVAYSDCEQSHYSWRDGAFRAVGEREPFFGQDYDRDRLYFQNFIPFMTAMFQRSLAEELGYFDASLEVLEDWDFWIRASKRTDFYRVPGATALYRRFVDRKHGNQEENVHRKHAAEWQQLAASTRGRIRTLRRENEKLTAALSAARREMKGIEGKLSWQWLGIKRASSSWRVIEVLLGKNARLRKAAAKIEREARSDRQTPYRQLIRDLPESFLFAARQLYRRLQRARGPHVDVGTSIEVRTYQPGDEERILDLFRVCFGSKQDLNHWRWKYLEHVWGNCKIVVASTADGRLLAHYAGYPLCLYDATDTKPRIISALQIGDTMTSPDARQLGRGRTSLLRRVTEHYFGEFCQGKVGLNVGFNTGKIQRYYLRSIEGSQHFEDVPFMVLDLEHLTLVPASEEYRVQRVDLTSGDSTATWDALFYRVAHSYGLLVQRDGAYVRWRYSRCPDVAYSLYAAYHNESLVGWSAFRQEGQRLIWGDGLFEPGHVAAFAVIVSHALDQPEHRRSSSVEGWFSRNPQWWRSEVLRLGFEQRTEPDRIGMIYKPFLEVDPGDRFRASLYYAKGDSDLF